MVREEDGKSLEITQLRTLVSSPFFLLLVRNSSFLSFSFFFLLWLLRKILYRNPTGTSLVVHWLGLCLLTQRVPVASVAWELRSHMPCGKKKKKT